MRRILMLQDMAPSGMHVNGGDQPVSTVSLGPPCVHSALSLSFCLP
ncbi:SapB/AmfS family lanthipeptide [Pseudonocardia sp. TRM90224]|nr:SapB/AmfS family lanthipeptide [Pseudonocardia sp. TRM90224]